MGKKEILTGAKPLVEAIQTGEYRVVSGDESPIQFDPDKLTLISSGVERDLFPGIKLRGHYRGDQDRPLHVISFLYYKLDSEGNPETTERAIILRGIGEGVHPGHTGQPSTRYLIGPQIGAFNHQTGEVMDLEQASEIPAKHFSLACIIDGPFPETILANPS